MVWVCHLLKFSILLSRVGVVEPQDHLALIHLGIVVVQHRCLDVTYVEVP